MIEEGALADLLGVDGDPETGLDRRYDPGANLAPMMKGGAIVKDGL